MGKTIPFELPFNNKRKIHEIDFIVDQNNLVAKIHFIHETDAKQFSSVLSALKSSSSATGLGANMTIEQTKNFITVGGNLSDALQIFLLKKYITIDLYHTIVNHPELKSLIEQSKSFEIVEEYDASDSEKEDAQTEPPYENDREEQKKGLWAL